MRHRTTLLALAAIVLGCLFIFPNFLTSFFLTGRWGHVAVLLLLAILLLLLLVAIFLVLPRFTSRR